METRTVEAASLSARMGGDAGASSLPISEGLIREIFASIMQAEETLQRGRGNVCNLSGPISRIDNGPPIYSPEPVEDAVRSQSKFDQNREPSLIEKLQMIRDRIDELTVAAAYNANVTRNAVERLDGIV